MSNKNLTQDSEKLARLLQVVSVIGASKTEISIKTGYSKATVGAVLEGKTPLTSKFGKIFCSSYSINEHWFAAGEGEMFTTFEKPTISEAIGDGYSPEVKLAADYLEVKLKGKSAEEKLKFIEDLMEEIRRKNK